MFKKDNLRLGLALGFLAPVLGLLLYYLMKFFPTYSIREFLSAIWQQKTFISAIATLSLFVNAVLITLFLNKRSDKTAIGIFILTLIYGISALLVKWFL